MWRRGRWSTREAGWLALSALVSFPLGAAGAPPPGDGATGAGAAITLKLPADLVYDHGLGPDSAVVFSHETHFAFEDSRCTGCHVRLFRMLRPSHRTSHAEMNAGRSCGACHDGDRAFGVEDGSACTTCHSGRRDRAMAAAGAAGLGGVAPPGPRLPRPHAYPPGESSPGRVTFRHETHMRDGVRCAACHPRLFGMKPAPPRPEGGMHEASSCGACHDGTQSFGAEDPDHCARCHSAEGGAS